MAYLRTNADDSSGPTFGERYVPEREEDDEFPPPQRRAAGQSRRAQAPLDGWGRIGEFLPPRRVSVAPVPQLRMAPFETIAGFARGGSQLSGTQLQRVNRVADFVVRSWLGASPITSIRITGHIDAHEAQRDLGQRRADAVRDALVGALQNQNPGLVSRLRWITEDRGFAATANVEIYLWAGPTAPPVPPLMRIPSPAEAARTVVPPGPETAEQRINRLLRTLPPLTPLQRGRSVNQWLRSEFDRRINAAMRGAGVPQALRPNLRAAAWAAVERGSRAVLDQALDAAELSGEPRDAVSTTVRALIQTPVR